MKEIFAVSTHLYIGQQPIHKGSEGFTNEFVP